MQGMPKLLCKIYLLCLYLEIMYGEDWLLAVVLFHKASTCLTIMNTLKHVKLYLINDTHFNMFRITLKCVFNQFLK